MRIEDSPQLAAGSINIETVDEGVETLKQLAHIESLSGAYWQGFLFSKPV